MTIDAWLASRTPTPPRRLAARIREALGERARADAAETPNLCVDAAFELLRELVQKPDARREAALDLLTVDALVTYAFEASASDPNRVEALARDSMARFGSLAAVAV